jgi:long-chain acyl-CoA synthetase
MAFLANIFTQLEAAGDTKLLRELRGEQTIAVTGSELLVQVAKARGFLASKGLKKGDRCALLGHNSIEWIAMDLAIMAEELIVVPLYARHGPAEMVSTMKDCSPALICCGDETLRDAIIDNWAEAPPQVLLKDFLATTLEKDAPPQLAESGPVTIIYTSGTSGTAKGAVLTAGNVGFVLERTSARLASLMEGHAEQDRVYHCLPFCFGASWIALLTYLSRRSLVTLNTDPTKIASEMREVAPNYFLNVPILLERMHKAVDEELRRTGGFTLMVYGRAKTAWLRKRKGKAKVSDSIWLGLANALIFPRIRKRMIGANLKALICGSAPLDVETQLYFQMLGIPVLQVYGLTETTGICTMDDPRNYVPGHVGPAIEGIEMKLGENDEITIRGPNVFAGYWNLPQETAQAVRDGWFHTGDQGEVDGNGNWKINGRIKNLIILGSGHNIAPEPIETEVLQNLPGAQQVVLVGNGRGYLSAIVTGDVSPENVEKALDAVNPGLPHYKQIRKFHIRLEPFSVDNGLLTVNGKLKRDLRMKSELDA